MTNCFCLPPFRFHHPNPNRFDWHTHRKHTHTQRKKCLKKWSIKLKKTHNEPLKNRLETRRISRRLPLLLVTHLGRRAHVGRRMHNSRHQFCGFSVAPPTRDALSPPGRWRLHLWANPSQWQLWERCERARAPLENATVLRANIVTVTAGWGVEGVSHPALWNLPNPYGIWPAHLPCVSNDLHTLPEATSPTFSWLFDVYLLN